jgi:riboflavin kinase/FMN adenylyltransferase
MEPRLEVHVLDFSGNLYGKKILVEFLKLLRREEKFPSIQALIAQMEKDKAKAEEIFRLQADSLVL